MLRSGAPTQLTQVFAGGSGAGPTNVVPLTPTGSQPAGQIAYSTGFTSTNMTPIASGGIAPWGADMNGLLKAQTQAQIYQQAGFLYPYSSAFSTAMSGYPAGAVLPMASGLGLWLNQTDGNTTNPDSSGASGWVPQPANQGATALTGLTGGTVVLTPNQLGAPFITLAGTLTSNLQVTLPLSAGRAYTVQNNTTGAYTVTVAGATGTGVTVSQGAANGTTIYTDGTNWYTGQFNGAGVYLPIAGTAVAATKLATARTITMTGDVSWTSPAFDGTANVAAAGTIAAGAVTLAKMASFQANSLMGNPTTSAATPSAITLGSGLQFSSSQLQLAPSSAQVIGWLGYTPVNKAGDTMTGALVINGTITASNYNSNDAGTADLNTLTTSGFYRLESSNANAPFGVGYGQLIACHGAGDTILQMVSDFASGNFYWRSGNPSNVGGTGSWGAWRSFWHSGNLTPSNYVPTSTQVIAGAGLSGGGALTGNVTLTANVTSVFGRTGAVALTSADVTGALGYTPVNKAGDTVTGGLTVEGALIASASGGEVDSFFRSNGSSAYQTMIYNSYTNTSAGIALTDASGNYAGAIISWNRQTGATTLGYATTVNGNLQVNGTISNTGTVNFNTSDETLKDEIDRAAEPQPLHRSSPFTTYRRTDTGERGRGLISQDLRAVQPLYVREYAHPMPDGTTAPKLGVAYAAAALEEAWWCGRKIDELLARIAVLEAR